MAPHECVGVLGGERVERGWYAACYIPLPNVTGHPETHYEADPTALIQALRAFRQQGLELAALFHSHPRGPSLPSASDIQQAGYDVPYLIADLSSGSLRGFLLPANVEVTLLDQTASAAQ